MYFLTKRHKIPGDSLLMKLVQGATGSYFDELFDNDSLHLVPFFFQHFRFSGPRPRVLPQIACPSATLPEPRLVVFLLVFCFYFPPSVLGSGPKSFGRRNADFSDVLRLHQYRMVWHGLRMEGVLRSFERIYPMNPGYRMGEHCGSFFLSSSSG